MSKRRALWVGPTESQRLEIGSIEKGLLLLSVLAFSVPKQAIKSALSSLLLFFAIFGTSAAYKAYRWSQDPLSTTPLISLDHITQNT